MAFFEQGHVRIHYEEAGSGFPLFVIPGGGQNSTIGFMSDRAPFNATEEFKDEYRCITADLRNAPSGQSSGPLEMDRPWDSYDDDHLALMDHLGIDTFLTRMYVTNADFVFSVPRDVVQGCPAPVLVMPDETPSHPYEPALESAMLCPKAEMTFYPWKDTKEKIPLAVRHVRTFLKANRPA